MAPAKSRVENETGFLLRPGDVIGPKRSPGPACAGTGPWRERLGQRGPAIRPGTLFSRANGGRPVRSLSCDVAREQTTKP